MESKHVVNRIIFFPHYFKKVGVTVIAISALTVLFAKIFQVGLNEAVTRLIKELIPGVFILGLFFIAWSKDRIEDELTLLIRLKATSWAFGWAVLYVIVGPIVDLLMMDSFKVVGGRQLVLSMLFVYLSIYYLNKRAR